MVWSRPALPPFWTLVELHTDELLAHAQRLVGEDAEDVVQEALLRGLRSYPRLRHGDHLRAWLYRITTTTAFDHSARRSRNGELLVRAVPEPSEELTVDDGRFEELIEGLSATQRRALTLRFVEDLDYEDMARRLNCTAPAARQRVSTAVRSLRERLS